MGEFWFDLREHCWDLWKIIDRPTRAFIIFLIFWAIEELVR